MFSTPPSDWALVFTRDAVFWGRLPLQSRYNDNTKTKKQQGNTYTNVTQKPLQTWGESARPTVCDSEGGKKELTFNIEKPL